MSRRYRRHFSAALAYVAFAGWGYGEPLEKANIHWSETTQEQRTLSTGTVAPFRFGFTNQSERPVFLTVSSASCTCAKATVSPEIVLPGKRGEVVIEVAVSGRRGTIRNWVNLTEAGQDDMAVRLSVTNFIEDPVELLPKLLVWEHDNQDVWRALEVRIATGLPDKIAKIECSDDRIESRMRSANKESEVQIKPHAVPRGTRFQVKVITDAGQTATAIGLVR